LPGTTRSGYAFTGWYSAGTGGTLEGEEGENYTPSGSVTLYAHWVPQSFTVSYNNNGGIGTISSVSYTTNGPSVIVANSGAFARPGYAFVTWNTAANGLGTSYTSGASLITASNLVLYAIWQYMPLAIPTPRPFTSPTPTPTPAPTPVIVPPVTQGRALAEPAPAVKAAAAKVTIDSGTGEAKNTQGLTPLEAALTNSTASRSVSQLQSEAVGGFAQGSSVTIKVSGARTTGQFILSSSTSIDTVSVAAALKESQSRTATDFAQLSAVNPVATVDWTRVTTGSVTTDATDLFKASGLGAPRTVADLPASTATHWVDVNANASGYVPGSVVYLAVTTEPIIFGSAQVDLNGNVTIDGLLPIDVLEPAAHSIRVVGTRNLGGVSVDKNGQLQLANSTMEQIQRFDKGTNAVVELYGSSDSGLHSAVRLVPLNQTIPWWILWTYLGALLVAFAVRRWKKTSRTAVVTLWVVAGAGMILVDVVAWVEFAYIMLPWAPLAAAIVIVSDLFLAGTLRGFRARKKRALHA
jgi:uncharacterized repeat protein (TIGR02543 family)